MKTRRNRSTVRTLVAALAMSTAPLALAGSVPAASASGCQAHWGSLVKQRSQHTTTHLTNVRSGRHQCFDRLVVDLDGRGTGRPGYRVEYVRRVTHEGSGATVPLRGGAKLRIVIEAPAYGGDGQPTYRPANRRELVDVAGYRTFRQVAWAGSFEGQTSIGLGVRARLPMRVLVLDAAGGGHRLVVDVAHRWY